LTILSILYCLVLPCRYVNPWAPPGTDVSWYTPETEALSAWTNLGWLCLRDSKLGLRELQALSALTGLTRLSCALLLGIVSAEDPGLPFDLNLELATIHNSTPPQQPQQLLASPLQQRFADVSMGGSSNGHSMSVSRQGTFESQDGQEGGDRGGGAGPSNGHFPVSNGSTTGAAPIPFRVGLVTPSNGAAAAAAGGAGTSVAGGAGASNSTGAGGGLSYPQHGGATGGYGINSWLQTSDDRSNNLSGIAAAQQASTPVRASNHASAVGTATAGGPATPSSFSTPSRYGRTVTCSSAGKRKDMPCLPSVRVLEVHTATVHCLVTLDMPALEVLCSDMDTGAPLTLYLHKGDRYQAPVLHRSVTVC
jgi:hypothetical protein